MTKIITDDTIKYVAKLHWVIFIWPVMFCLICLILGLQFELIREIAFFFLIFGVFWLIAAWANYYFSSLTIEKRRVIFKTGVLVRKITDIPVSKIESVDIRQNIWGSILHYGALMVVGTGGTKHYINCVSRPLTCRRYIEELMHES